MSRITNWRGGPTSLDAPSNRLSRPPADEGLQGEMTVSLIGVHGQVETQTQINLSSGSLWRECAALSFMRASPYDIRPDLLLYVAAQDDSRFDRLFSYGCDYLTVWAERAGMNVHLDAVGAAVVDGLEVIAHREAQRTVRERAKDLHMRASVFCTLRAIAVRMFKRRYQEASARFIEASSGIRATHESVLSNVRELRDDATAPEQTRAADRGPSSLSRRESCR